MGGLEYVVILHNVVVSTSRGPWITKLPLGMRVAVAEAKRVISVS